jgi:RNA polymerase sigma-70 factor, ECF subfamily
MEPAQVPEFATLVREHQGLVFSIALNSLRDRAAAEELAQDVFLQLHQHMGEIRSADHAGYWLRKVTAHRCIDYARRSRLRPRMSLEDAPEPWVTQPESDPLLSEKLRKLVASLPEKARLVMILRFQEDLEPAEIAGILGMPVRTVKSHLQRSLAMLREKVNRTVGAAV